MRKDSTVRSTSCGEVRGTMQGEIYIWYGVPYGKEPSGALRWKAPQKLERWENVYDASSPAEQAMQLGPEGISGTEDCLKLDIYSAPKVEKKPVLVFLHGGNNQNGTTEELKGTELVQKADLVFVAVGYRLGLLGFNPLPAAAEQLEEKDARETDVLPERKKRTGNFALLDIAAALDWIRENIAAFGGDPENITVSGFSAGGRNVMAMLISPIFAGKFEKAVVFSGGMTTAKLQCSKEIAADYLVPLAIRDRKAADEASAKEWLQSEDPEVRKYLYSLSAEELCSLIGGAAIRMQVFPHLFADGSVLPENGFDAERYNHVPLMMVSGTTEFSCFADGDPFFQREEMNRLPKKEQEAAMEFAVRWGSAMYRHFNVDASAQKLAPHYRAPVYLCDINYGNRDSACPIWPRGAFHGIFLPMLWSQAGCTADAPEGTFGNPAYQAMAELFQQYLKNFLYTGNPNGRDMPEWPEWKAKTPLSLMLDGEEEHAEAVSKRYEESFESIIAKMEQDRSVRGPVKEQLIRNVLNGRWFSSVLDERYQDSEE